MKKKILIVDDDKYVARLLEEMLKDIYIIRTATNGIDALELVYEFLPDIILLDIMMPHMSGYEVCRKIREEQRLPYVKILLLSAKNFLNDRLEGYKAGANDYVTKPFDPEEVKAKIRIFLQLKYADEVNRIKDDLLTLLSHEKNTPLNSILGFAELLRQMSDLPDEAQNYISYILDSAHELQNNTHKTLLLCQLKEGYQIVPITGSLKNQLDHALKHFEKEISDKNLVITCHNSQPEQELEMDSVLLSEALRCLLENAIHHSPVNGTVTLEFDYTKDLCHLLIKDEGEGFQTDNPEDIFEMFISENVLEHTKGLGLSMALARMIAETHGGSLTAANNESKGACFTLTLPLTRDN